MTQQKRPIIALSGNIMRDASGPLAGYSRSFVNDDYVQAVIRGGGVPIIIPVGADVEVLEAQCGIVDGFIFTGGVDIDPIHYGEEVMLKNGEIDPRRDAFDLKLMEFAMASGKPILGICRGMQLLNVFNGGDLYQDLSLKESSVIKHNQEKHPESAIHQVSFMHNSILHGLFGDHYRTNSFHHQAVKEVAKGFQMVAMSRDGILEAMEKDGGQFVIGVQWHPEMMAATDEKMHGLFVKFVEACNNRGVQ